MHKLQFYERNTQDIIDIIYRFIENGVIISFNNKIIAHLPNKIFFDFIEINDSIISDELELECIKYSSYEIFTYIKERNHMQNKSDKILVELTVESFEKHYRDFFNFYVDKIQNPSYINYIIIRMDYHTDNRLDIFPINHVMDPLSSLILLMNHLYCIGSISTKYMHPTIIKYSNINFDKYFKNKDSYKYFTDLNYMVNKNFIFSRYDDMLKLATILLDVLESDIKLIKLDYTY